MNHHKIVFVLLMAALLTFLPVTLWGQTGAGDSTTLNASNPASPIQRNNGGQLTASAIVVLMLDWLKKSKWLSWLTTETETRNRLVALLGSLLAAVAVHATFDRTAGVLTITGLTLTGIATGLVAWLKSYVFQQMLFKMSVAKG